MKKPALNRALPLHKPGIIGFKGKPLQAAFGYKKSILAKAKPLNPMPLSGRNNDYNKEDQMRKRLYDLHLRLNEAEISALIDEISNLSA